MTTTKAVSKAALLAALALGACGQAAAQEAQAAPRTISVSGQGEATGAPDEARINAGVQTLAPTVVEASRQNQAVVGRIMRALEQQGIDARNIRTTNYSIRPEQHQDPRGSGEITITGYHVSNVVNVTIDDIDKVGAVLAAVTNAGANSINGIDFGVSDTAELERRARAAAMTEARGRAEALAGLAGVELGEVLSISMSAGGGGPMPMMGVSRMEMIGAAPVPGISPGELSVTVQVQVTWAIR